MTYKFKNFCTPHSHQRSLDSASLPEEFAKREIELGTGYLCSTEHGTLGYTREILNVANKNNLKFIPGLEGYYRDPEDPILKEFGITGDEEVKKFSKYMHCTLHFQDQEAYETAIKCISDADLRAERHGSERKPLFTWAQLELMCSKNTVLCSGCLVSFIGRSLMAGRPDIATRYYEIIRTLPQKGNFFCEVMPHDCSKNWVNGVIFIFKDGTKSTYWLGKKIRTNHNDEDIAAQDLAKLVSKHEPNTVQILQVKNGNAWVDFTSSPITKATVVQDFIQNEPGPFAPNGDVQLGLNKFIIDLANKYGDPILISDDSHYATRDEKIVQDIRLTSGGDSWKFSGLYHRQSSEEAFDYLYKSLGVSQATFSGWIENSYIWANKFNNFKLENKLSLPISFYPKDTLAYLKELIEKHGRMDWNDKLRVERLKKEIDIIHSNGTIDFLPYFSLAEDGCYQYEKKKILTGPGRGSGAGVLINYLLSVTHVDPLKYDLSVERFMTKERIESGKYPDIDQDLCSRDLLIGTEDKPGWLKEKFNDCYAQISTDTTLKIKSSIKDVCRAKRGMVLSDIEELCKKIPMPPQGISDKDFIFGYEDTDKNHIPGIIETDAGMALRQYISKYPEDWTSVIKLLGINRQKSVHASAFIIADRPIDTFIPLTTISDVRATQYTASSVEQSGGLKMDYLVVNSLQDIQDCIKLIHKSQNLQLDEYLTLNGKKVPDFRTIPNKEELYDVWDLPEDQAVFNDICEGKTETIFQLNTNGAQKWLKSFNHLKPNSNKKLISCIEDLAAFTALDRPGALDAYTEDDNGNRRNMLQEFALRAQSKSTAIQNKFVSNICKSTYGVLVYQEQLQKIYQELGGTTASEANSFREKVGKKKMEEVLACKPKFLKGAIPQVGEYEANEIWETLLTWGQYGFNCIGADQKIITSQGPKKIEEISINDWISSVDEIANEYYWEKPTFAGCTGIKEVFEVCLENNSIIKATLDHKFLFKTNWYTLEKLISIGEIEIPTHFYHWGWSLNKTADFSLLPGLIPGIKKILKIKSVHSLGMQSVYDLTMPKNHNFVLQNGAIAHNCSHAISYATMAYACAYLKHYYPLEWWCAVLKNADKTEIGEVFWSYCGHLIDMPDINLSKDSFDIQNGRIRAPIGFLMGIGEIAHKELCENRPYADMRDFCVKIANTKTSKTKINEETGKSRKGTSALNRGVVTRLILSGATDSLFMGDLDIYSKLDLYSKELAEAEGKKKIEPIPEKFINMNYFQLYQMKKQILSVFNAPLKEKIINLKYPEIVNNVVTTLSGKKDSYSYMYSTRKGTEDYLLVSSHDFKKIDENELAPVPCGVAMAGYVLSARTFVWQGNTNLELTMEVNGDIFRFVKWADRRIGKPNLPILNSNEEFNSKDLTRLEGSIIIALLSKWTYGKPFNLTAVKVVQPALTE